MKLLGFLQRTNVLVEIWRHVCHDKDLLKRKVLEAKIKLQKNKMARDHDMRMRIAAMVLAS